jgi:two-component system, OmpR family, phosphate regulon sensor histidine kinase PhoR
MLFRRNRRASNAAPLPGGPDQSEAAPAPDRQLTAVASLSSALARARDEETVARILIEECFSFLGLDFAAVALVSEDGKRGSGLLAVARKGDTEWWREVTVDFEKEPSGIASAVFEGAPVVVYDVAGSARVNRRLADLVGAKSAVFVPLISDERIPAVLVIATTREPRVFTSDELALLQALSAETALALDRTRSANALAEALERERLVASIGRKVRSELDLEAVLRVAVEETGQAAQVTRCFLRLGEPGGPMPIRAEWDADGFVPIGAAAGRLPVSNLAAFEGATVAVGDVREDPRLADTKLGGVQILLDLDTLAVLATPIVVFDRLIGVFGLHRSEPGPWSEAEISLAEAVARELAIAIHAAQLLEENTQRLEHQTALLKAAQVVTSELRLETVLQRLVVEVTKLLQADAADCYLYDADRSVLRCAAVYGLDSELIEFEFPAEREITGRFREPVPHPAYEGFASAIAAPMTWSGERRGMLGVATRDSDRRFGKLDFDLLETFAGLASLAVRNAASFEQSVRQARVQRGFYGIASALAEPLSQPATLDAVAQAASEALGGSSAAVLMPIGSRLELAASYGLTEALASALGEGVPESAAVLVSAARDRLLLSASSLAEDDRFGDDWRRLAGETGIRSLLAIPVDPPRREEGGLVVVFFAEQRTFTDDDLELGRRLAGAARGALERSELYESERTSRALSQQLARMGGLLAAELDPAAVLDEVADQAPALLAADACAIQVVEGDELVVSAVGGKTAPAVVGERLPAIARPAGDVIQSRSPVVVADASEDPRLLAEDPILRAGHFAYLGVPLIGMEEGLQAVLAVYAQRPRTWREEEIEALAALAGNASAVLSNAELYQRVAMERERSYAILVNIADGIVAVDREGKVVLWNQAAEHITGVPAAAALGRTPVEVLQRELASEQEGPARERLLPIQRGGEEAWLSVTEAIMRDPAGAVSGRIFAFRDVSSERIVEQMKSDFVSTVSHELRAPLTSIYGFAETLLRRDVLFEESERQTFLNYIASEAQRLTTIVDTLLSVARLDAGDLHVELVPTDLRSVVSEVVTSVRQSAEVNGHHFVLELPDEPLSASADREKLSQILTNLLDNAVKFSPGGGTVTVEAHRRSGHVEVRVVDEGQGIPEAERERIFTKFHRADASVRGAGGAGLGLFIARGLVAAMGGRIWVDSAEGGGSSFAFELPLAQHEALERD